MQKVGMPKNFTYSSVTYDEDGWADAKLFMPADFDLCLLKIKGIKTKPGWASGSKWDGSNVNPYDEILYWKKQKGE